MKAVVIGPGRIGAGFAGQALRESGYEVVFLARNPIIARHLDRVRRPQHGRRSPAGRGGMAPAQAGRGPVIPPPSGGELDPERQPRAAGRYR